MEYFVSILLGYLLGSSSMTYYLGRLKNIDVRNHGTGNLGASNAAVTMGWGAAVLVAVHDIGKAILAVVLARWLFPGVAYLGELAGVACVIGHMFPFYLGFRGGKGLASFIGMTIALDIRVALGAVILLVLVTVISDFIALGTVALTVVVPLALWLVTGDVLVLLALLPATAVMVFKHLDNLKRIAQGKEIGLRSTIKGEHRVK